jgi:hypothetical protein
MKQSGMVRNNTVKLDRIVKFERYQWTNDTMIALHLSNNTTEFLKKKTDISKVCCKKLYDYFEVPLDEKLGQSFEPNQSDGST